MQNLHVFGLGERTGWNPRSTLGPPHPSRTRQTNAIKIDENSQNPLCIAVTFSSISARFASMATFFLNSNSFWFNLQSECNEGRRFDEWTRILYRHFVDRFFDVT